MPIAESFLTPGLTAYVSVAALGLSLVNLVLARLSERKRNQLQQRSDELEVERLLDKAWEHLFGSDGFEKTKSFASQVAAEGAVDQAQKIAPKSHRAVRLRGHIYEQRGNKTSAKKFFLESLKIKPADSWTLKALGDIEADPTLAIDLYEMSLACDPDNAWSHYCIAIRLEFVGDLEEASLHFERAAELEPRESAILNAKAEFLRRQGQLDKAEETYSQAIRLDPTNVDSLIGFGKVFDARDNVDEAVSWILRAARCTPDNSYPYAVIAAIYADRNRPLEALEYINKAIDLDTTRHLPTDVSQELRTEMQKLLKTLPAADA